MHESIKSKRIGYRWCLAMALSAMAVCTGVARAQYSERSFVIKAGTVIPVSPTAPSSWSPGVVIVREGKVVAAGRDLPLPPDLPVIELPDATVMPGLVAASSTLVPAQTGDESMAAGYMAADSYLAYADYRETLAGGVTTVHLSPGRHRLVTGQGAVVKLGGPLDERFVLRAADLTLNFSDAVYHPPKDVTYTTPSSSDLAIPMPLRQRPDSRVGQFLALDEALAWSEPSEMASRHYAALAKLWQNGVRLRVQVDRSADIAGAVDWLQRRGRSAYFVGGAEACVVADRLREAKVPLVYELGGGLRDDAAEIGYDPDAIEADVQSLRTLDDIRLALATVPNAPVVDLRLAAATALRADLDPRRVIEAVTIAPAEMMGVADRVGSLEPGKDADLLVLNGDPLATTTHVQRVYIGGSLAFEAPKTDALVVQGHTIWIDENEQIEDGAVLIEDGKITAVGKSVPHPPFARFIDAGADSFITPGLIDAHGHLGLMGDSSTVSPELKLSGVIGAADVTERRVARAGVTTVVLAPYRGTTQGSQLAAIHTSGHARDVRVVRDTVGVYFDVSGIDPAKIGETLKGRFEAGKKYLETWQKYEKELAEWKEKKAKGEAVNNKPKVEVVKEGGEADPLTGTWAATISGGPLPEPQTATMRLKLTGQDVEGRLSIPGSPEEVKLIGTFDGKHLSAEFDVDTGGQGTPRIEADLVEEDVLVGKVVIAQFEVDFNAERTDKESVEFKVSKRRTRGKDGRPLPPKVDEALEPLRSILEKKAPALIKVSAPAQIAALIKFMEEWETPYVLLDAEGAREYADTLAEKGVGVVVPKEVVRREMHKPYLQADDLSRSGVMVAFQSHAEDAARTLPLVGLHAVERGLGADEALAAMTTRAAKMFMLDDVVGSLSPGRSGDLVIFSGHPFAAGSYVKRVIIQGEEVR